LQAGDPIDLKSLEGYRYYLASLTDGKKPMNSLLIATEIRDILRASPKGGFTANKLVEAAEKGNLIAFQGLVKQYKSFMGLKDGDFIDLSDVVDTNGFVHIFGCQIMV
jgi:hypothetical protein